MNIWIDDQVFGSFDTKEELETKLNEWIEANRERILYLFECDDEEYVFEEKWLDFVKDHVDSDEDVYIFTAKKEELLLDLVSSTREYVGRLVQMVDDLAERFYASPDYESWKMLADFLVGLHHLDEALQFIQMSRVDLRFFREMLMELQQAMERRDVVTIADVLSYEYKDWLLMVQKEFIDH